jgi:hypothetical protein
MFVKAHWNTQKGLDDLADTSTANAPWGWVKRCLWNERLGRDHIFLRPIPKSVVSGLRYPTNKLSSLSHAAEGGEEEDGELIDESGGGGGEREEEGGEGEEMNEDQFQEKMSKSFRQLRNVPVWFEQLDESGYPYYYNQQTGESRWEPPEWVEEIDPSSGARFDPILPPSLSTSHPGQVFHSFGSTKCHSLEVDLEHPSFLRSVSQTATMTSPDQLKK